MALKLRRGLEADRSSILPAEGEIIYTTDQKQLFVGDGETAGGTLVSSAVVSVNGIQGVVSLTTDEIEEGASNLYFSDAYARAAISVTGSGGSYDSETGVITLTGGGGTTSDSFKTISVAGQSDVVADSATDTLTLVAGSGITITTNAGSDAITINSTATSSVENLDDLLDVDAGSPTNGQALSWNSGTSKWEAKDVGSGTVDSAVVNQIAFYTDTYTVGGSTKFTIDDATGNLFVEGTVSTPFVFVESDGADTGLTIAKHHDSNSDSHIALFRSRGDRLAQAAVELGDTVMNIRNEVHDGVQFVTGSEITSYVSSSPVNSVEGLTATLSTGTAIVTLTTGDTAGLIEGQALRKISGSGAFGTNWDGSFAYIVSVDTPTQITVSVNHSAAGSIVFNSLGLIPNTLAFSHVGTDGRRRKQLRIRDNGAVSVGPDIGDFDGADYTGQLQVISMVSGEHDYNKGAFGIRTAFDGVEGQEISFTRSRGSITLGGIGYAPSTVVTGDEIGSLGFYGFYEPNPGADNLESSRIIAEVTGTVTSSAIPGKIRLQTANASGSMGDVLALSSTAATFSTRAFFAAGTEAAPGITFDADASKDTGLWHAGDGVICVSINATEKVRVDNGGMRVVGFMKVGGFGTGSLPFPAEAGMIVLDTDTNEFKGYNGSAWVVLG